MFVTDKAMFERDDKEMLEMCFYLEKIYENERVGLDILERYLEEKEWFAVYRVFTKKVHIQLSDITQVPAWLRHIWIMQKIHKELQGLFENKNTYDTSVSYANLPDDAVAGGIDGIFELFSVQSSKRNVFNDPSEANFNDLMLRYVNFKNALVGINASSKKAFLTNESEISVDKFLAGNYDVVTKMASRAKIKESINVSKGYADQKAVIKDRILGLVVTTAAIKQELK